MIVCLHVDDMIYIGNLELTSCKHAIQTEFEMTDLGIIKYFLVVRLINQQRAFLSVRRIT